MFRSSSVICKIYWYHLSIIVCVFCEQIISNYLHNTKILLENIPFTIYLRFVLYWAFEYIAFEAYALTSRNLDHLIMTELLINDENTLQNTKEDP